MSSQRCCACPRPPCTALPTPHPTGPWTARGTTHGRYLKAKAGKPPAGYVTTYTVAGAPDKVRRARAHTTPAPQPACGVHSRATRIAHARGLPPAHCLASACPPARRTSASPRSASPATWCPPSSPPPPWRSSSVSSARSRCERSILRRTYLRGFFLSVRNSSPRIASGGKGCLFDRVS